MKYGVLFAVGSFLLAVFALAGGTGSLLLLWPAGSFGMVAAGYLGLGSRVYGKSARGILSPINQAVLLPYLLYLWLVWYALRLFRREAAFNRVTESLIIGRRLLSRELPGGVDNVVDLTCEFHEPRALRSTSYSSFQILDGFVPTADQLRDWVGRVAAMEGTTFIHCAEGHGRTGLVAAGVLVASGSCSTAEEAVQFLKTKRPLVRLARCQMALLKEVTQPAGGRKETVGGQT